jgi:putative sigma-54 modulation protein
MKITVQAPFQVSEQLQTLVEEKVEKLQTFFERIISAEVYFKEEENRRQNGDGKTVEIRLNVPRQTLFSEEKSDQFEKALVSAAEKMRKQLNKYKQQNNDR